MQLVSLLLAVLTLTCVNGETEGSERPACYDFSIIADNFPGDISWSLNGGELKGGCTKDEETNRCKESPSCWIPPEPNQCVSFYVRDSYGDGICCASGIGKVVVKRCQGEDCTVVARSSGVYKGSWSRKVCPKDWRTTAPDTEPITPCCKAMTASCAACSQGITEEQYCKENPRTLDCKIDCDLEGPHKYNRGSWDEEQRAHCCKFDYKVAYGYTKYKWNFNRSNWQPWGCAPVCSDYDGMGREICEDLILNRYGRNPETGEHEVIGRLLPAEGTRCSWVGSGTGRTTEGKCEAVACSDFTAKKQFRCPKEAKRRGLTCYWKNNACSSESNADVPCTSYKRKNSCKKTGKIAKCMYDKKAKQCYGPDDPKPQITCSMWKNPKKCRKLVGLCRWALDSCTEA